MATLSHTFIDCLTIRLLEVTYKRTVMCQNQNVIGDSYTKLILVDSGKVLNIHMGY